MPHVPLCQLANHINLPEGDRVRLYRGGTLAQTAGSYFSSA